MAGEPAVRHRLPVGDGEQRIPDRPLEGGSAQVQLRGEVRPAAGEIAVQARDALDFIAPWTYYVVDDE